MWSLGEICFLPAASAAASALAPLAGTARLQAAGARALWLACLGTCGAVAAGASLLWNRGS